MTPVVYISPGFYSGIGSPGSLTKMPLWEADWGVSCPSVPSGFHGFTFWQSSESASVPGISGHVDEDRFNGTRADLTAFAKQAPAKPKAPTLADDEGTFAIAELDGNGTTDIDGDGKADACAFNGTSINCYLSRGDKFAAQPIDGPDLPADEASKSEFYSTIRFADINGDGKADICARESTGVVCWLSDGHGFGEAIRTGEADGQGWVRRRAELLEHSIRGRGRRRQGRPLRPERQNV